MLVGWFTIFMCVIFFLSCLVLCLVICRRMVFLLVCYFTIGSLATISSVLDLLRIFVLRVRTRRSFTLSLTTSLGRIIVGSLCGLLVDSCGVCFCIVFIGFMCVLSVCMLLVLCSFS